MVYRDAEGNVAVVGGRFMTERQLHVGLFSGDAKKCLDFAKAMAAERGVKSIHCLYPDHMVDVEKSLLGNGFTMRGSPS